jgi:predicted ATPase
VKAARLDTLTGTAGSGKTRLALELAGRLAPHYTRGACFVELAPVQQVGDVVPTLARALDVPSRSEVSTLDSLKLGKRSQSGTGG